MLTLNFLFLSWIPIQNQYSDIDENWYIDIGTALVKTMVIMAVFPWVELVLFSTISVLKRILDSGWYFGRTEDSEMRTKVKT